MDFLKRHTEELQKKRVDEADTSHGLFSSTVSGNGLESPTQLPSQGKYLDDPLQPTDDLDPAPSISSDPLEHESVQEPSHIPDTTIKEDLLLQINRVPFEKWLRAKDDGTRGKSVLDVAMQSKEGSETKPSVPISDSQQPSDTGSSDAQRNLEVPVRLAINSNHIHTQLHKITSCYIGDANNVMHPPWKLIVTYHEGIKKRLQELEKRATEHYETFAKGDEQPEPGQEMTENEFIQVEEKDEAHVQEGDGSSSAACEVCDRSDHNERLECLSDTVSHFKCFADFIDNDLKHVFELRQGLKDGTIREIAFEDLWHLFSPGDVLIRSGPSRERQAYKVFYTSGGRPTVRRPLTFEKHPSTSPFMINCYYIDFDRKWLGPVHQTITIPRYVGKRPITGLTMSYSDTSVTHQTSSIFPIWFLEESEIAISDLVKRGRRHRELTPFSHKRYCGPSSVEDPEHVSPASIETLVHEVLVTL